MSASTRTSTWAAFERRFEPITRPSGTLLWELDELPCFGPIDPREWWTVLDCDGRLYLAAGFHFVNRFAYVRCEVPWTDADELRDYCYEPERCSHE
jgi:hypothetical protein